MTDVIDRETETNSAQPGISDARLKELVEQARAEGLQLTRYCQILWMRLFQATSDPVLAGSTAP
ncbi:hypothetical protein, partial [Rhodococcus qingshengii]